MLRPILVILLTVTLVLAVASAGFAVLAASSPLGPDHILFSVQEFAEKLRADLLTTPGNRLYYAVSLLDRRSQDLARLINQPSETAAFYAVDRALNRVMLELSTLSTQQRLVSGKTILARLSFITGALDLARQRELDAPSELESLAAKVSALYNLLRTGPPTTDSLVELTRWALTSPAPLGNYTLAMLRQGASGGFTHDMFSLSEHHTILTCVQCHTTDQMSYSASCETCHIGDKPPVHIAADCAACHFTASWVPARMNHAMTGSDCSSCHLDKLPASHYPGNCSLCHGAPAFSGGLNARIRTEFMMASNAWLIINFNHAVAGVIDCQACHEAIRPPNHFSGQCSTCHTIGGFVPAIFTHQGDLDCFGCHAKVKPASHFPGQCSDCHTPPTTGSVFAGWKDAAFDHPASADDCVVCHALHRPDDHFAGQCSVCHTVPVEGHTAGWSGARYNHLTNESTDCINCHRDDKPVGHYTLQCSVCHAVPVERTTTSGWLGAAFNHASAGSGDCISCHAGVKPAGHYSLQCSACHVAPLASLPSNWLNVTFNHALAKATDCISCHTGTKPANHYNLQCSLCHTTLGWLPVNFNHAAVGATDCISCHSGIKPANHYVYQCSSCHTTSGWLPVYFNHALVGATNCLGCHLGDRPAGHYTLLCSLCHTTNGWLPADFNHEAAGATDCIGCHLSKMPAYHFQVQCSQCHSTSGWMPPTFNHSFPLDHGNADAKCTICHPNQTTAYTCFGCHSLTDLQKKHPKGAALDDCMACHPDGK